MGLSGTWHGQMEKVSLDCSPASEQLLFQLDRRRDWLGRISGKATAKSLHGNIGPSRIMALSYGDRLNSTGFPPVPYTIEFDGFRPLHGEPRGGEAFPVRFEGKIELSGQSAFVKWRTSTWMMKSESRRKVQVIVDRGRWRMEKQT
jgi:hypothetical protein